MTPLDYAQPVWLRKELGDPTGRGVRVAIVDSGIDSEWAESDDRRARGTNGPGVGLVHPKDDRIVFVSRDVGDRVGHGSACSDILLRVAPEVQLFPVRVFNLCLDTSVHHLTAALRWCVDNEIHLVNLSLGTMRESSKRPLYHACEAARRSGLVLVAAVDGESGWSYPAVFENTIGVEAGRFESPFDFIYHRDGAVEFQAQGGGRFRWAKGRTRDVFGASFAAPHVSGLAALWLQRNPGGRLEDVREGLTSMSLGNREAH